MAKLKFENGRLLTQLDEIRRELEPLKIELSHWPIEKSTKVMALLRAETLDELQKEELLRELDGRFVEQRERFGYQARDLVVLHTKTPQLDELLAKFDKCHRHSDDEVRYIVDGAGIFGFTLSDGQQIQLTVESEEFIRVPAGAEHWFVLDSRRRVKAVRYFTNKEGWVASYTGTPVHSFG